MSEQTNTDMSKHFYRASAADFMKIPGSPVAYWSDEFLVEAAKNLQPLGTRAVKGLDTNGKIDDFLRRWFEVSASKFSVFTQNQTKWFPLAKGGEFRKWYGNHEFCINYESDGLKLRNNKANLRNQHKYFAEGLTWTVVSSGGFAVRYMPTGFLFDQGGSAIFAEETDKHIYQHLGSLNSFLGTEYSEYLCPTLNFTTGDIRKIPIEENADIVELTAACVQLSKLDWDQYETSWEFESFYLIETSKSSKILNQIYNAQRVAWEVLVDELREAEKRINRLIIQSLQLDEMFSTEIASNKITLNCNSRYRFDSSKYSSEKLENLLRSSVFCDLLSYSIGCMMGRYSLDKPGLILASQGETIQDYLAQIQSPKFMPDDDAILPLTDQEWFADDVTNRFREFVKVVWGEETLQENLDFVAESLCLHAIKPKNGETSMEAIRLYLSTQFYKDHMKTYKKRPIYWLFSSGKQKAFECLVYLHRYNEGTLSRMRTEYVTPLMGKYESQIRHIEEQQASATAAEKTKLEKELKDYQSKLNELREFDSKLKHYADMRISLDLDDGVKVNYGKFGDLLANVKDITGEKPKLD